MTQENYAFQKLRIFPLILAILIPLAVGAGSALLTAGDIRLYDSMAKPFLAPPGWVFPVVWTVLYVMMGIASYLVYVSDADRDKKRTALLFYAAQLVMNLFWCSLFFTYKRYLVALIWLLVMWVLILITAIRFFKIHKGAGLMMTVLFLWTTFAAYLNLGTYILSLTA